MSQILKEKFSCLCHNHRSKFKLKHILLLMQCKECKGRMWPTPPGVLWMQKTNEARDTPQSAAALNIPARDSCSSACMPHQTCPPLSPLPHLSSPPALPAMPQPLYGVWFHAVGKTRLEGPLGSRQGPGNCHRLLRVEAHRGIWQVLALIKPRVVVCF